MSPIWICGALLGFLFLQSQSPAHALPAQVTVQLFSYMPRIDRVVITGRCRLVPPSGDAVFDPAKPAVFIANPNPGADRRITLGAAPSPNQSPSPIQKPQNKTRGTLQHAAFYLDTANQAVQIKVLGPDGTTRSARYAGQLKIYATATGIAIQNRMPIKQYLAAVVGSECPPGFSQASLEAQAVLATNVLHQALKKDRSGTIPDSTTLQSFGGLDHVNGRTIAAVDAVFPRMLCDETTGQPIEAYYSSTCAGGTSDAREIFGAAQQTTKDTTKTTGVTCTYCEASPFYKPHVYTIERELLQSKLGYLPKSIVSRDHRGRPLTVEIAAATAAARDTRTISGYALWLDLGKAVGWGSVPGNLYEMRTDKGAVTFTSRGCGHGVGYCQWGGEGLARKKGFAYPRLLYYYFPRTRTK